jgi:CMP/dCMP kinase
MNESRRVAGIAGDLPAGDSQSELSRLQTDASDEQAALVAPPLASIVAAAQRIRPAIITIDGPAASGKSTVGLELAQRLGYLLFDTGVMYRAVTHAALARKLDVEDGAEMGQLAEELDIDVLPPDPEEQEGRHADGQRKSVRVATVLVDGEDITDRLRLPEVDRAVSAVSAHSRVRIALSEHQRRIGLRYGQGDAEKPGIVMVGRDIGTVVMPDAPVKIYMDASVEERARRRYHEMRVAGKDTEFDEVRADIERRDLLDSARAHSPLRAADDSVVIDTSHLTPQQVLNRILGLLVAAVQGSSS